MGTLIVHPENKEQLAALKAFIKALKISIEEAMQPYDPEFMAKIQESHEQVKRGDTRVVNIAGL